MSKQKCFMKPLKSGGFYRTCVGFQDPDKRKSNKKAVEKSVETSKKTTIKEKAKPVKPAPKKEKAKPKPKPKWKVMSMILKPKRLLGS